MQLNRGRNNLENLTNGPAKLTQALEITKEHYGIDLTKKSQIYIEEGIENKKIKKIKQNRNQRRKKNAMEF